YAALVPFHGGPAGTVVAIRSLAVLDGLFVRKFVGCDEDLSNSIWAAYAPRSRFRCWIHVRSDSCLPSLRTDGVGAASRHRSFSLVGAGASFLGWCDLNSSVCQASSLIPFLADVVLVGSRTKKARISLGVYLPF